MESLAWVHGVTEYVFSEQPESVQTKSRELIGTYPLVPYEERGKGKIAYLPAPRCKGLDCKAVIVVGFDDYKSLQPGWRHTFCLAVSRAREMLAVVNRSRPKTA